MYIYTYIYVYIYICRGGPNSVTHARGTHIPSYAHSPISYSQRDIWAGTNRQISCTHSHIRECCVPLHMFQSVKILQTAQKNVLDPLEQKKLHAVREDVCIYIYVRVYIYIYKHICIYTYDSHKMRN